VDENPFHVLGLPVTASDEEVARQYGKLARKSASDEREQARLRRAWEELRINPLQRGLHVLYEMPGASYGEREDEWRAFQRENRKSPVDLAALAARSPAPADLDLDVRAAAGMLADFLAGPREAIVRGALAQPPALPGAGAPPIEMSDVIIGWPRDSDAEEG
jgi:hypothetical protein